MSSDKPNPLQTQVDQLGDGETLKLDPPRAEVKGPLVIRKAAVIDGQGGIVWATTGPVVQIEADGVELRHLAVEVTSRDANLSGDGACAIKIQPGVSVDLADVEVRGSVIGVAQEEGDWQFPRSLALGSVRAGVGHEFRLLLITPVPCTLTSEIDALKLEPQDLPGGPVEVRLRLDTLPIGTRLRGPLLLRTRQFVRRIELSGHCTGTGTAGTGQVIWQPAGMTRAPDNSTVAGPNVPPDVVHDGPAPPPSSTPATVVRSAAVGTRPAATGQPLVIVSATDPNQIRTITEALQHAPTGARIVVRPGVYRESLTIHKRVEILGDGPAAEVVIESPQDNCVLMQADRARLHGLTLRASGRAMRERYAVHVPQGQLILEDCRLSSESLACAAATAAGANLTLRRCHLESGVSVGLLVHDKAEAVLEECEIVGQALAGVECRRGGVATMHRCRISKCRQTGLLVHDSGQAVLETCEIFENQGSGVECRDKGTVTMRRCEVRQNKGAGLYFHNDGHGTLEECDLFENGLANLETRIGGKLLLRRCRLRLGKQAGLLFGRDGQGVLEDCEFSGNAGPAVEIKENANPNLKRCTVRQSGAVGISVRDRGRGLLEECDLSEATVAIVDVRLSGAPVLTRCKIHDGGQAGVLVAARGRGTFTDCEIFANHGPGVAVTGEAAPTLKNCRIHNNLLTGVVVWQNGRPIVEQCELIDNELSGLAISEGGAPVVKECRLSQNGDVGLWLGGGAEGTVSDCDLTGNRTGALDHEAKTSTVLTNNRMEP